MIASYFYEFEQTISDFLMIEKQFVEKIRKDDEFGIIRGALYFEYGIVDFIEVVRFVSGKFIKIKYKYHFMDNDNNLIFRYDNAKHHKDINTFPHHKHTKNSILPSIEPDIFTILKEIQLYFKSKIK